MRIYSMTATFGKLEHETLTLEPGFNILQAPNEWGKSTWCAFLVAMLYGLETRAKSTKSNLADKDRYAPWSGSPMAGRVDLNWLGRDITIERKTRGRMPMGEFRAYETATGLPVPELNGANCGQLLLGVERSVFLRSGFIRLSDLPVTNDEALRRRLNALVTTGDESSAADRLAKGLKDLKNKVRYHRTGLLPQTEGEIGAVEERMAQIHALHDQMDALKQRRKAVTRRQKALENHRDALAYQAAEADAHRVAEARQRRDEAETRLRELDDRCADLPSREQLQRGLAKLARMEQAMQTLEMEEKLCDSRIDFPEAPAFAGGASPEAILKKAISDGKLYRKQKGKLPVLLIMGLLLALSGAVAARWRELPGLICAGVGILLLTAGSVGAVTRKRGLRKLEDFYGSGDPNSWLEAAKNYKTATEQTEEALQKRRELWQNLNVRRRELEVQIAHMTQGMGLLSCKAKWEQALDQWDALSNARRDWQVAENQLNTVKAMARTAMPPAFADEMTYSEADTLELLLDTGRELRQIESRMHLYAGRVEALGDPEQLKKQLEDLRQRKEKLEDTYAALTIAQEALAEARLELQRRFAPRISKRAAELMGRMTDGRYDRLQLAEDFSLLAGAEREDTLHEALWRSEGTLDQLYLSLRIAVAEALAPDAPLILDDALVRFDDVRLKAALDILKEEAEAKQVILFTCQSREMNNL